MRSIPLSRKNVVIIVALLVILFLVFQLFSLMYLTSSRSVDKSKPALFNSVDDYKKLKLHDSDADIPVAVDNVDSTSSQLMTLQFDSGSMNRQRSTLKRKQKMSILPEKHYRYYSKREIRGILPTTRDLYLPDVNDQFTCLKNKNQVIPFSQVNDDYCDCSDSTDEPGTSACPLGRFFCLFQFMEFRRPPIAIPSSRVNDGICDCCDGSDEYLNISLPPQYSLSTKQLSQSPENSTVLPVYQTPCINFCGSIRANFIRQGLVPFSRSHQTADIQSLAGQFAHLIGHCYSYHMPNFYYTICPFGEVYQQEGRYLKPQNLGKTSSWEVNSKQEGYKLRMSDGDSVLCPDNMKRRTTIEFTCGSSEKVLSVTEPTMCVYHAVFSTPAAC